MTEIIFMLLVMVVFILLESKIVQKKESVPALAVNYHFTRKCNYECGFCFHTEITSYIAPEIEAKRGLKMLADYGVKKINFAGGEPFIEPKFLGEMVKYCKKELNMSVSIVSNGSKITEQWLETYSEYVDILAISCDSFIEETNYKIGRRGRGKSSKAQQSSLAYKVRDFCDQYNIKFKINTVVNKYNFKEDMSEHIDRLKPDRWKVFQVLAIEGENTGENSKRNVKEFLISSEEFEQFIQRHINQKPVKEDNDTMRTSYLILDEYMRFLDNSNFAKTPSKSLLEVGVEQALKEAGYSHEKFINRGGYYEWNKDTIQNGVNENNSINGCGSSCSIDSKGGIVDIEDLVPPKRINN